MRLLVSEVEQTVAWMVRVQAELGAVFAQAAARSHCEGLSASVAKLVFALGTSEMHAPAPKT